MGQQRATAIETHLANAGLAFRDGAAVSAGVAADPVPVEFFIEIAFLDMLIDDFAEGGHLQISPLF